MIERFVINIVWKRIILCLWIYGGATPILVDHETGCIQKIISLSFHAYK
jgi:hypothetical protein